jgi:hypothetical protein
MKTKIIYIYSCRELRMNMSMLRRVVAQDQYIRFQILTYLCLPGFFKCMTTMTALAGNTALSLPEA